MKRTALKRKSVVADGAGMVDVRSMDIEGGVCVPVGVMPPEPRPLRGSAAPRQCKPLHVGITQKRQCCVAGINPRPL